MRLRYEDATWKSRVKLSIDSCVPVPASWQNGARKRLDCPNVLRRADDPCDLLLRDPFVCFLDPREAPGLRAPEQVRWIGEALNEGVPSLIHCMEHRSVRFGAELERGGVATCSDGVDGLTLTSKCGARDGKAPASDS